MGHYLVTGGAGFIGSHLVDSLLVNGHRVRVLDDLSTGKKSNLSSDAELITGCITDIDQVKKAIKGVDGCFHLAAIASVEKGRTHLLETHLINSGGMVAVLDAISHLSVPIPVVYASSAAIYGNPNQTTIDENTPAQPINTYGADKLSCEFHARAGGVVHNIPSFGLRLFNIYGSRQNPSSPYSGVISVFVDRALKGRDITIFGDGEQIRDFVHVSDTVVAFRAAMNWASINAPVVNVCTGKKTSVLDLAYIAQDLASKGGAILHEDARVGDIRISIGNNDLITRLLDWHPTVMVSSGLSSLINT